MGFSPPLFTFLLMIVSGWVQRRQLIVIEYLQAENRLLKARLYFLYLFGDFHIAARESPRVRGPHQ